MKSPPGISLFLVLLTLQLLGLTSVFYKFLFDLITPTQIPLSPQLTICPVKAGTISVATELGA